MGVWLSGGMPPADVCQTGAAEDHGATVQE